MAKRYTDTEKWDSDWFHNLTKDERIFWLYLQDRCNIAGIWEVNWRHAAAFVDVDSIEAQAYYPKVKVMNDGTKWFLPEFILSQQSLNSLEELNPRNFCHSSILKILYKENIIAPSPCQNTSQNINKSSIIAPISRGYSNSNSTSSIQPNTSSKDSSNMNGIKSNPYNIVKGAVVRNDPDPVYEVSPPVDYSKPENFRTLMEEVGIFRKLGFSDNKIRQLFSTRNIEDIYVEGALEESLKTA